MAGFGFGPSCESMVGFPHFRNVRFEGEFPVAKLSFTDPDFPSAVKLTAFNPLIPHNDYDSSLPAAFFEWEIENTTDEEMDYSLSFSVQNPAKCSLNTSVVMAEGKGIFFLTADKSKEEIGYSDLTVLTDHDDKIIEKNRRYKDEKSKRKVFGSRRGFCRFSFKGDRRRTPYEKGLENS